MLGQELSCGATRLDASCVHLAHTTGGNVRDMPALFTERQLRLA